MLCDVRSTQPSWSGWHVCSQYESSEKSPLMWERTGMASSQHRIPSFYEKLIACESIRHVSYLQEKHPVWPWETWESSDNNPLVGTRPQQRRVIWSCLGCGKWIVRMDNITSPPSDGQSAHTAPTRAQRETAPPGTASSPRQGVHLCLWRRCTEMGRRRGGDPILTSGTT